MNINDTLKQIKFENLWKEYLTTISPMDKLSHMECEKWKEYCRQVFEEGYQFRKLEVP